MSFDTDLSPEFAKLVEEAQHETACMLTFWSKEQISEYLKGTKIIGATSEELEYLSSHALAAGNLPRAIGLSVNAQTVECIEEEAERLHAEEDTDYHPIDRPVFGRKAR